MIVDIFNVAVFGGALFLSGRAVYHAAKLTGLIVEGVKQNLHEVAVIKPAVPEPVSLWTANDEQRERLMFLAVPTATWLDPNRWGDQPGWRDDLPRQDRYVIGYNRDLAAKVAAPKCPVCGPHGQVTVLATHGDQVSMWDCMKCGAEFTRKGETRKSRKTRLAIEARTQAEIERNAKARADNMLPCGCEGDVRTRAYPTGGWDMGRYAECVTCGGCWDYAEKYGESGNKRKMHPRSGPVEWPNGNKLNYDNDMPLPPSMANETVTKQRLTLPCGCPWETPVYDHGGAGWRYVRCQNCQKAWEPASNSPSGRLLAQGEQVRKRTDIGALPRPTCPKCGTSHPKLQVPIDGGRTFYRCNGCEHHWNAPLDMHNAISMPTRPTR